MHDLAEGRCQDWFSFDYWKEYGHFNWETRCPYSSYVISPQAILESIRGSAAYVGFDENPVEGDKILDFLNDLHRLNIKFEDWTTARCFWPNIPGSNQFVVKAPFHYYFFGTQKDMMTIKMILNP